MVAIRSAVDGQVVAATEVDGQRLQREEAPAERRRRRDRRVLVGHAGTAPAPAVHRDAADRSTMRVSLPGPGRATERGDRGGLGVARRHLRRQAGSGLVDAEVGDRVGCDLGRERGELVAVARIDPAELAAAEPAARRDEVDADVRLDTLPTLPWSTISRRLVCKECGVKGSVHIVPNWHDRIGSAVPFTRH